MDCIHPTAAGAIGNTPLVMLNRISKDLPGKIAVKLEYMNPTCSVKDRAASAMIDDAEKRGLITPGKSVLIEATSGNMGIALAFFARIKGYKIVLVMPSAASLERRALMIAFGAELIITDPTIKGIALIERVKEIAAADPNFYLLNQFGNQANADMHYRTTGPEIWRQTQGKVDIVCFGVGSGGTVTGTGKYLREQKKEVEIYAVEPAESAVISGDPPNLHKIQGIGAGFVPDILDKKQLTDILKVTSDDALVMAKRLATEESILGGITSGANVCAAVELASRPENAGKLIVTTINSSGERYLSTVLYNDIKDAANDMPCLSLEESIAAAKKLLSN
ncbi:hypothetical protein PFISCL1PPCAC_5858 [Pristionchus fissidentatus]|uniref:Cysteine synthase n=1 Tax=Pristionchus fissidentatus TaxID=1538716 RepID=A0AAV5V595_9BILA|nr:hypothetical protein PFISCL1PPCAC_5858 [Pristionchus fissidentatus]